MILFLRLLTWLLRYPWRLAAAQASLLAATVFAMAVPWLIKEVIDVGLSRGEMGLLFLLAGGVLAASALRGAFAFGQSYLTEYLGQRVAFDLRNALYDRFQRLSFAFHDTAQTGQLMSRATVDVEAVRQFISMGSTRTLQALVLFLLTCGLLLSVNWRLALVSFAVLPFVSYRAVLVSARLRPVWLSIQERMAELGVVLQENLSGVRVVRAFTREDEEEAKFAARARDIHRLNIEANRQNAFNSPLMTFLLTLSTGAVLWFGGHEVIAGRLTLGELVAFNGYLFMLAMPVRTLGWTVNLVTRATAAVGRIFEVLDTVSPVQERPHARELKRAQGHVRFEQVSFSYNAVAPVLRGINLDAQPGEMVALVGATGSGKSTVVSLIPRFYDASAGRITIDGVDLRDVTLASLRHNVGIVLQDTFLFSATVGDNIAYGAEGSSMEEIRAAAQAAHIHDFITSLPEGYDTWVGERGITLSGGQKQRVAIARTLLTDPRILILDDATSSVDTETEHLIQQALVDLMRGRTTFVIAQRLRTLKRADQILVLQEGEVVERGRHAELLERGGLYRQIYDLQLRDQEEAAAAWQDGAALTLALSQGERELPLPSPAGRDAPPLPLGEVGPPAGGTGEGRRARDGGGQAPALRVDGRSQGGQR